MLAQIHDPKLTLLIVGDGPCHRELKQQAEKLRLGGQVIFAGMVSPKEISHYYYAGNLFVSASVSEAQGLTYLEALSAGLPLLCRKDDCLQGVLIDGRNGWQYTCESEFMSRLRQFRQCPQLRDTVCSGAGQGRWKFSVPAFAERAEQVYHEQMLQHKTALLFGSCSDDVCRQ